MYQKLTVNLKKAEEYQKKIKCQLQTIGNQILSNRLQITQIENSINQATKQKQLLEISIKRQKEQQSNYQYKYQKIDIRLKQYNRKLVLQQQIFQKKKQQQNILKQKIQNLQRQINEQNKIDQQISMLKNEIQYADTKLNKQAITLQNLYHQLMNKNKQIRAKQDELILRKKQNSKKMQNLKSKKQQKQNGENKQNINQNCSLTNQQNKLKSLSIKNSQISSKLLENTTILFEFCQNLDMICEISSNIKKEIGKQRESNNQIKTYKNSLNKIQQNATTQTLKPVN